MFLVFILVFAIRVNKTRDVILRLLTEFSAGEGKCPVGWYYYILDTLDLGILPRISFSKTLRIHDKIITRPSPP